MELCARSIKSQEGSRLVVAADAGPMQIQLWEGAVCRCAEPVQQGTAVCSGCSGREHRRKVSLGEELRALKEEFCYARKRSGREHAETCKGFEFERVVSCGSGDRGWRTKLDFGSGESFDDHHRSTAFGTAPETAQAMGA